METLNRLGKNLKPIFHTKWFKITVAVLIFLLALGLTLYPLISSAYSQRHASAIHTEYLDEIKNADTALIDAAREAAMAYNATLIPGVQEADAYSNTALAAASGSYADLLNLSGNGLMGYLSIPKLSVTLPIYHGTSDATLEIGVGHLLGSSLPVGGESTHTILTGHSGMASNKMLSDLEDIEIGDVFYLEVLGETLVYQVDQIKTVLPYDTTYLGIEGGQDFCTLVTCTPFGVNTHRLLVRGTRIEYTPETEAQIAEQAADSHGTSGWMRHYLYGILGGIAVMLLILAVIIIIIRVRKSLKEGKHES